LTKWLVLKKETWKLLFFESKVKKKNYINDVGSQLLYMGIYK